MNEYIERLRRFLLNKVAYTNELNVTKAQQLLNQTSQTLNNTLLQVSALFSWDLK